MAFDVIGFSEGAPGTGTVNIAGGLQDTLYTVVGDNITLKSWREVNLLGLLYLAETTPGYAEIYQAGRDPNVQFVKSADVNDLNPLGGWTHMFDRPIQLKPGSIIQALSNNATDEDTIIGLILGDGYLEPYKGPISERIRGICDQTLTANTWTACTITWDKTLEKGRYAIVGMVAGSYVATPLYGMARLLLKGAGAQFRPGGPLVGLAGDKLTLDLQGEMPASKWPQMANIDFDSDNMPNMELLSPGALTDHVLELELVRIG